MIIKSNSEKCYLTHSISELVEAIYYDKYNEEIDEERETGHPSYVLNDIVFSGVLITTREHAGNKESLIMFTIRQNGSSIPVYVSESRNNVILKPWETHLKDNIENCVRYGFDELSKHKAEEMFRMVERYSKLYEDILEIEKSL